MSSKDLEVVLQCLDWHAPQLAIRKKSIHFKDILHQQIQDFGLYSISTTKMDNIKKKM